MYVYTPSEDAPDAENEEVHAVSLLCVNAEYADMPLSLWGGAGGLFLLLRYTCVIVAEFFGVTGTSETEVGRTRPPLEMTASSMADAPHEVTLPDLSKSKRRSAHTEHLT